MAVAAAALSSRGRRLDPDGVVTLRIDGGPASAFALLVVGSAPGALALPNGCTLAVSSLLPLAIPLATGPGGAFAAPAPIRPALAGQHLFAQALFVAGGASDSLELIVAN